MRLAHRLVAAWGLAALAACPVLAQSGSGEGFRRLAELEARFQKRAEDLDRSKLTALAALARETKGPESEAAYRELFDLAVARGFFNEAEPAARAYHTRDAQAESSQPETRALAASIILIARAGRGEYDQSLADMEGFLQRRAAEQIPDDRRLSPAIVFVVGEAYLQRLIQGGRYDVARKACRLVADHHPSPEVKAYFQRRDQRLSLIGQPAKEIEGIDIDGRTIHLSDFKGKVVLIDFWATWCPPCMGALPQLRHLAHDDRKKGLVVLGVNLDTLAQSRQGATGEKPATPINLRRFLVAERVGWPNLVGPSAEAAAKAYQVEEIPMNFLVGRDGVIRHVELREQALEKAVDEALAEPSP
jgi:thiol-disulfide isomerase/thioredoxin